MRCELGDVFDEDDVEWWGGFGCWDEGGVVLLVVGRERGDVERRRGVRD